jgi:hypothetical protein
LALPAGSILCYPKIIMPSISDNTKKRGRPATTGKGTLVGVRLLDERLAALDTWIAAHPDPKPSRPEAIRRLVEKALS